MSSDGPRLTVLIPASPVPSHPSLHLVEQAVRSLDLLEVSRRPPIVICHDQPRPDASPEVERRYRRYLRRLERHLSGRRDVRSVLAPEWGHLAGNIRHGLEFVETEFVLILQHDFFLLRPIDIEPILDLLAVEPDIKHVRFNKRSNVAEGFDGYDDGREQFFSEVHFDGLKLCRTLAWSDNPHICRTDYYGEVVLPIVGEERTAPEIVVDPIATPERHREFGTFVWGGLGDPPAVGFSKGRTMPSPSALRSALLAARSRLRIRSRLRSLFGGSPSSRSG